jgi:flagellar hook-associated protein 2
MATISSVGIGSGLDVNSIVSQLVALEKQPLTSLALKATNTQNQISAFGEIRSQFASLTDVASRIADASAWSARNVSTSNSSAATLTATGTANATSFTLDVVALAVPQSVSSAPVATDSKPGAGTLTFQLGTWNAGATAFTSGSTASVDVVILATDKISDIAAKINAAGTGVVATSFNDGKQDRLLLQAKNTGEAAGFQVKSAELGSLVFDPEGSPGGGMAANTPQYGHDAKAKINGFDVTSASNTLKGNLPGVTIQLVATTVAGAPVKMGVSEDVTPAVKNVSDFVAAYNTLNKSLADLTKYSAATKAAGLFQGDSTITGLQNVLRNMIGSASLGASSQHLSAMGITKQLDGSLSISTAKLSVAANDGTTLQQLFTANNNDPLTNGFALKFRDLGKGLAATGGSLLSKTSALQGSLDRNTEAQTKVTDRAALFETRLRKQYSALDAQMAQLTALNNYVSQQVTLWNKSTG